MGRASDRWNPDTATTEEEAEGVIGGGSVAGGIATRADAVVGLGPREWESESVAEHACRADALGRLRYSGRFIGRTNLEGIASHVDRQRARTLHRISRRETDVDALPFPGDSASNGIDRYDVGSWLPHQVGAPLGTGSVGRT